jgi:retron-type reverse transcriptase
MQETFNLIIDKENIKQAYLSLVTKFDLDSKSSSYIGLDGVTLNDYNYTSLEIIELVHNEMLNFTTVLPASSFYIPKKNSGKRTIYIYSIKERLKAEAIYRVIEPLLNPFISPYVYSYRSSHPSYYAARSVVRRYKRFFGKNHILTADLSDYTDSMNHSILIQKIRDCGVDAKTLKLIELFIKAPVIEKGRVVFPTKGLMTGTPLSGLFANLFMQDFDNWAGRYLDMYRRVGDDMIAVDSKREKILKTFNQLEEIVLRDKLILNQKKVKVISDHEDFVFLGYKFSQSLVSFDPRAINRTLLKWQVDLNRYPGNNLSRKLKHFKTLFFYRNPTLENQFRQIIRQKNLVDDQDQVKNFSDRFYALLTKYFFGVYSPANRRKLFDLCKKDYIIKSLFKHYTEQHFTHKHVKK